MVPQRILIMKQPIQLNWANAQAAQAAHHWLLPEHLEQRGEYCCLSQKGLWEAQKRFLGLLTKGYVLSITNAPLFAQFKAEQDCKNYEIDEVYIYFALWAQDKQDAPKIQELCEKS